MREPPEPVDQSRYIDARSYGNDSSASYYITAAWDENAIQAEQVPSVFSVGDRKRYKANGVDYVNAQLDSNTRYGLFVRYDIDSDVSFVPLRTYSDAVIATTGLSHELHYLLLITTSLQLYHSAFLDL